MKVRRLAIAAALPTMAFGAADHGLRGCLPADLTATGKHRILAASEEL
ncbi:MAG: hypothetical protein ACOC0D_01880 [Spirochaeta sp.]